MATHGFSRSTWWCSCVAVAQETGKPVYKTFSMEAHRLQIVSASNQVCNLCSFHWDREPHHSMQQVETDASLSMPWGTKQAQDPMGPPRGLAFSFQCADTGQHWTIAETGSSLTSVSAGYSQSHIKLSENPKVPVRSVNSSIVPAPPRVMGQL